MKRKRYKLLAYRKGNHTSLSGQRQLRYESPRRPSPSCEHATMMMRKPIPVADVDPLKNWFRFPLNLLDWGGSGGERRGYWKIGRETQIESEREKERDPTARDFWHTFHLGTSPWPSALFHFKSTTRLHIWRDVIYGGPLLSNLQWLTYVYDLYFSICLSTYELLLLLLDD